MEGRLFRILTLCLPLCCFAGSAGRRPRRSRKASRSREKSLSIPALPGPSTALAEQMAEDIRSRTATTRPELASDLGAVLADLKPEFDSAADAMTDRAAQFYAQRLSRRELGDSAVFFAGPSGKAYVAAQPALLGDLADASATGGRARPSPC